MSRKFSVLLPTRDRLELAKGAIETVRRQAYDNWELVISDNCSHEDVGAYVRSLNDPRIIYSRSDVPLHVTENWNRAIDASSGDYVVMLGDDDGLIQGYFERTNEVLDQLEDPDFIYMGAYHYTFPGVLDDCPNGKVVNVCPYVSLFQDRSEACLLPLDEAHTMARAGLDMQAVYGFNMQYFLFNQKFLNQLREYGPVFQGPFPDFYAANMAMLLAERIGLLPEPMIFIGISPKSYGYYHFNGREKGGMAFLNAERKMEASPELARHLLPGTNMNTSWLISVDLVRAALGQKMNLDIGVKRYRRLQIFYAVDHANTPQACEEGLLDIWRKLSGGERGVMLGYLFVRLLKYFPYRQLYRVAHKRIQRRLAQYPRQKNKALSPIYGDFQTMQDVFDKLPITPHASSR